MGMPKRPVQSLPFIHDGIIDKNNARTIAVAMAHSGARRNVHSKGIPADIPGKGVDLQRCQKAADIAHQKDEE
jgi:hypothetical protein